jgi:hypothetical protein
MLAFIVVSLLRIDIPLVAVSKQLQVYDSFHIRVIKPRSLEAIRIFPSEEIYHQRKQSSLEAASDSSSGCLMCCSPELVSLLETFFPILFAFESRLQNGRSGIQTDSILF